MSTKKFKPSTYYRIMRTIVSVVFLLTLIAMLFGLWDITSGMEDFNIKLFLVLLAIVIILSVPILIVVVSAFITFPSIRVTDEGFRLDSLLGKSQWLPWTSIKKVRKSFFPGPSIWFIGVSSLNWYYYLNGLIYWMGTGTFLIGKVMENHNELLQIIKKKRPDLFY